MTDRVFILGGTRSGKSSEAVRRARAFGGDAVTFVATARRDANDPELAERITSHRAHRPAAWVVAEIDHDLAAAVRDADAVHTLLVDSLTLWTSTLLERAHPVEERWREAEAALARRRHPIVIVSDELGLGMVPLDPVSRRFRDDLGRLHQAVAAWSTEAWLMVAGLPLRLK